MDGDDDKDQEPSSSKLLRLAAEEIANPRSCSGHPHILQLYCVIQEEADDDNSTTTQRLVSEFVGRGDLYDYIASKQSHKLLPKQQAKYFFQQISYAVTIMHSKQIAHRDLSLSEIADFGLSKHYFWGDDDDDDDDDGWLRHVDLRTMLPLRLFPKLRIPN